MKYGVNKMLFIKKEINRKVNCYSIYQDEQVIYVIVGNDLFRANEWLEVDKVIKRKVGLALKENSDYKELNADSERILKKFMNGKEYKVYE